MSGGKSLSHSVWRAGAGALAWVGIMFGDGGGWGGSELEKGNRREGEEEMAGARGLKGRG